MTCWYPSVCLFLAQYSDPVLSKKKNVLRIELNEESYPGGLLVLASTMHNNSTFISIDKHFKIIGRELEVKSVHVHLFG